MKPVDIIRLIIIIVAVLFGYYAIVALVDFISFLPNQFSVGDSKIQLGVLLKVIGFAIASWLLIKNNRKISNYIEEQK